MPSTIEIVAAACFGLAVLHSFATGLFARLALARPSQGWLWHGLAEVELVFALWALALVAVMFALLGGAATASYLGGRSFTEPLFVFAIMLVAASRPVLHAANKLAEAVARLLPLPYPVALYFMALAVLPLTGSLITEPAAMTLAALLLRDRLLTKASARLCYATLGVLFVNVSIGGALTPYAAPPVLMVAGAWGWDLRFMLTTFGGLVLPVVLLNAAAVTWLFHRELACVELAARQADGPPAAVVALHLALLGGIVWFAHQPLFFLGLLLLFVGLARATPQHQARLMLKEVLGVALFLAGLVVLGGLQRWWLEPALAGLDARQVLLAATGLTAVVDNAALTYLAAQVPNLSEAFKAHVVAGAIAGGGLTVIANAPNPAGLALLRERFEGHRVSPLGLFAAALPPTLMALGAFQFL